MSESLYYFNVQNIDRKTVSLGDYRGKVLLIVNVASKCGFTPQYTGLENIFKKYAERGFSVLGFPCNQFGAQEPGSEEDIKKFCSLEYPVSFPMFAKVDVNGDKTAPVYQFLKKSEPGILGTEGIKWNFTKFLVDRKGQVVKRFAPTTAPESISKDIEALL